MTEAAAVGVAELLAARADDDNLALLAGDDTWTWREVVAESATRAAWLSATLDPAKPPNVGLLLDNTPDFVFTLFGAALAGATVVGINSTRRGAELERDISHTDCQLVLTDHDLARLLTETAPTLVEDEPWKPHLSAPLPATLPDPSTLLLLIFTSGSTSAPKAVRRSSVRVAAAAAIGFTPEDTIYISMPLIHGNALFGALFPGLVAGARIALRERFSASGWLDDVRRYNATFTTTVGRALSYVLATPLTEEDRDHRLKIVLAPESSPRDAADFTERFGVPVVTGYGQSEGGITLLPSRRHGALGRAPHGTDVAVVDAAGVEKAVADIDENGLLRNPEEAIGELVRRDSTGSFEGYWANDEANASRLHDGWYWSGDLAYRDADGVFFFAGRAGDWLRVDSENFAAAPIERIIDRHDDVAAVAVVGVSDTHNGDQVLAALQLIEGRSFDPDEFGAWLEKQADLGTKWTPRFVRVTTNLPTVAHDKIDRQRLKRDAWATADPVWWRPDRNTGYRSLTDADRKAMYAEFAANDRASLAPAHVSSAEPASSRGRKALAAGFTSWFAARDGSAPTVSVDRPQPGLSSDTLLLDVDAQGYVARLPPQGSGLFPDYDLARQATVQQAVSDAGIPAALPLAMETDLAWVGSPFLMMPRISGRTLTTNPPYLTHGWLAEASADEQTAMFRRFVEMLARIHRLDPSVVGTATTGGGPSLTGVLDYWDHYLDWATDDADGVAVYKQAVAWCRDNLPADPPPSGLLWGDPQLQNLVVEETGEIAAVLDWEMSGLGPAELDLSWFLVLHEHAAETAGTDLPGFPGRATIIEWYEELAGREIANLHFYDVLANLRTGAIVMRIGALMTAAGHSASWTAQVPQPRHLAKLIASSA